MTSGFTRAKEYARQDIDAGLRNYLNNIYLKMATGVLLTALVALGVGSSPSLVELLLGGPQRYIVIFAPLMIVWFGFNPMTMKSSQLMLAFYGVSVAYGLCFSVLAVVAAHDMIFAVNVAKAFFIATAMFAGLSIYGYTTKSDLTPIRTFSVMGIWGLIAASVMNIFFQSDMMANVIAAVGIVLFSGITIWQTQEMKLMYRAVNGQEMTERLAWAAALNLYISFIALFQYILHFMNQR
ncbi:MAG: Bax inhibitor-1/YccA family protein [Rhodospirillales bacterium]|nr:Bax inhibitor-1/YccA family protein [Alphaproteobacteria bacterium]MCB1839940.1 Bax inhibitor-1/YccA family protein [Alphaproteobacteria bacterium]MCB9977537.1 Bax inhibitor-1/YccA family protein [Rhodospirillales bacterium]